VSASSTDDPSGTGDTSDSGPASFGVVGAGWRSEYFLRIAAALPERFVARALTSRTPASAQRLADRWGVPPVGSVGELDRYGPVDFVLVAVPWAHAPGLVTDLVGAGRTVLVETPPAPDLDGLLELHRMLGDAPPVQVAEQYARQPQHAARLALTGAGVLGPVGSARLSVAHGYHGVSLLRQFLGWSADDVEVRARRHPDPVLSGRGRDGWASELTRVEPDRVIAELTAGDGRFGVLDFAGEQYLNPVRSRHLAVWGERGELVDDTVRAWAAPGQVVEQTLRRFETGRDGDLEGSHLRDIALGEQVLWSNPFAPARLSDDELAGAEVLARTARFAADGTDGYSLANASQDHYLSLLIDEAARTGEAVRSVRQPWSATIGR